jgi:hypothetical protein
MIALARAVSADPWPGGLSAVTFYVAARSSTILEYKSEHFAEVEALWREAFPNDAPWNNASTAIAEKIAFNRT